MSLIEQYDRAAGEPFRRRLAVALTVEAGVVEQEPAETPGHAARLALALAVSNGADVYAARFALKVIVRLGEGPQDDAAMQTAVHELWTAWAGGGV